MEFMAAHPLFIVAFVALVAAIVGWRVSRAAIRALRLFIRSLWPH